MQADTALARSMFVDPEMIEQIIRDGNPDVIAALFGSRDPIDWDVSRIGLNRESALRSLSFSYHIDHKDPDGIGERLAWEAIQRVMGLRIERERTP